MKIAEFARAIPTYRKRGVLVDTNLLLLYFTGLVDAHAIANFKPLRSHAFTPADYELLLRFLNQFDRIVTTPHILAEVSNHSDKLKGRAHDELVRAIAFAAAELTEEFRPAKTICELEEFRKFGLTDAAITAIAARNYLVLTIDFPLAGHLESRGIDVINFNHLRPISFEDI